MLLHARSSPLCPSLSLFSLIPHILCRSIKHGRNRGIGRGRREAAVGGERHSSRLFKYRGCAIRSVCWPARVSERVSERLSGSKDKRWWVGVADSELIWLSASAIVPETGLLYASVTVLWLLAHRYRSRVPASAFLYMTLSPRSRRRAPPFLRNKRAAKSHDALFLFFHPCLYSSLLFHVSQRQLLRIIVKERKRSRPLEFLYESLLTSH